MIAAGLGRADETAIVGLQDQIAGREAAILAAGEGIEDRLHAVRLELEDRARAEVAAVEGRAVEIAVTVHHQAGIGKVAVTAAGEAVEDLLVTGVCSVESCEGTEGGEQETARDIPDCAHGVSPVCFCSSGPPGPGPGRDRTSVLCSRETGRKSWARENSVWD